MVSAEDRVAQLELMRRTAVEAGRDPGDLECTRWGSLGSTPNAVALRASEGVDRLVFSTAAPNLDGLRRDLTAFAERFDLGA